MTGKEAGFYAEAKNSMARPKFKTLDDWLDTRLKDPEFAVEFLKAHLESEEGESYESALMEALREIARVHGITRIAERADLSRNSLYKILSADGNPSLRTFTGVLSALGIRLSFEKAPPVKAVRRKKLLTRARKVAAKKAAAK